jgi:hemerythrin
MIEWSDVLDVGVFEIDQQHRELVRRFNDFATEVEHGGTHERIVGFLIFMQTYAIFHFAAEEELMRKVCFPGIEAHIIQHELFTGKQFWMHEALRFDEKKVAKDTVDFVEKWIVNHVFVEDKKIGAYVAGMSKP